MEIHQHVSSVTGPKMESLHKNKNWQEPGTMT